MGAVEDGEIFLETSPEKLYLKDIIVKHKSLIDKLFIDTIKGIVSEFQGAIEEYYQKK